MNFLRNVSRMWEAASKFQAHKNKIMHQKNENKRKFLNNVDELKMQR